MTKTKHVNRKQDQEKIIQEGVNILQREKEDGKKPNIMAVKRLLDEKYKEDIPYRTLYNRFNGFHQPAQSAHVNQMLLTSEQEDALVEWVVLLSEAANPVNKWSLRKMAMSLCGKRPGNSWVRTFLAQHPEIKLARPSGLDPKRGQAFNRPVVERYFKLLTDIIKKHNIPPERRYNMDKKACQRGGGRKVQQQKYFVARDQRPKYKHRSDNLELVTIIEAVCADGSALTPGFVFSGTKYCDEWFDPRYPGLCVSLSENGWTSDSICLEWFKKSFVPQVRSVHPAHEPVLLIYDGHGSHESLELLRHAKVNNIILLSLPPHTTHRLQPLDVRVFGPFSRAWTERCDEIIDEEGQEMPREHFVQEYMDVRSHSFKSTTILAAWRKSGATPVNPNIFDDTDYAPSMATSYANCTVPASFPIQPSFYEDDSSENHTCEHCLGDDDESTVGTSGTTDMISDTPALPSHSPVPTESLSQPLGALVASSTCPPPTPSSSASLSVPTINDPPSPPHCSRKSLVPRVCRSQFKNKDEYIAALEQEVAAIRSENRTLGAHCHLMYHHYTTLKRQLNMKEKRTKRRKLNVEAHCLTTDEFLAAREKENDERLAEEEKREAERNAREAGQAERQHQRETRDQSLPFTGSLKNKNKDDLKDIAFSLKLSMDGTNSELISRIESHLISHPDLCQQPVYAGLSLLNSRGRRGNMIDATSTDIAAVPASLMPPTTASSYPSSHILTAAPLHHVAHLNTMDPPVPANSTFRPAGPSSNYIPPGYIAHIPSYYFNNTS